MNTDNNNEGVHPHVRAPGRLEPLAYDALYVGALGVLAPSFLYRIAKGKYRKGWRHKLGFVPERDAAPRIWLHAVSVGEAVVARTLAAEIRTEFPDHEIVVSTITPTGQKVARDTFGAANTFYLPLDFSGPVRRAFARTKPSMLVLMELELWPNLIAEAARRGVPVVIVNGRISDRAFPKYRRVARLFRKTMRRVALVACQTELYAERFRALGAPPGRVVVTGTMKYDGVTTAPDPGAREWARAELGIRPGERVLLGASTHRTEELALARAWRGLEVSDPWRLVVAPRHPERVPDVETDLAREGIATVRRTDMKAGARPEAGMVVIVDTVGELGRLCGAADLVFVGGSLIPHGGQSPIEAAGLGKAVVFGPHMFNFTETEELLVGAGGARRVADAEGLAAAGGELAADADARGRLGAAAREAILSRQGACRRTVELIREVAGSPGSSGSGAGVAGRLPVRLPVRAAARTQTGAVARTQTGKRPG